MSKFLDFLLQLLSQFAGGPGMMENNLVRFILPAILWGALLVVAWSRQREHDLPREKLLVWGFGLGAASSLLMAVFVALQMLEVIQREATYAYLVPLDHALAMASIVVVAGAFLRYILDDARIARLYLLVGLAASGICLVIALWRWPSALAVLTEARFYTTWDAWLFEVALFALILVGILLLQRKAGWLSRVVTVALMFFLFSEALSMVNLATARDHNRIICPIGNSLRILAIPLLGYVYLREQSIDKRRTEKDLEAYRQHLEELVEERTSELTAQNAIAATLSRSLDLKTILDEALDQVLSVVEMDIGLVFLYDSTTQDLTLRSSRGRIRPAEAQESERNWCCCLAISREAIERMQAVVHSSAIYPCTFPESNIVRQGLQMLVSVPLVSKERAVGALTLGSRRDTPVQQAALDLLVTIGQQIGMAIENAHLYEKAERAARELTLLHQMSLVLTSTLKSDRIYELITEQSAKLLDCETACILAWDPKGQGIAIVASYGMCEAERALLQGLVVDHELSRQLLAPQNTTVIDDAENDAAAPRAWVERLRLRALLCVPIRSMHGSLGTLFMMDRVGARRWRLEELQLIESFVSRAAVALMNADLCRQLEWAAALEERQRIAADMHDGLAQTISLLGLQVEDVIELIRSKSTQPAVDELANMRDVVEQASADVRRSIASLQAAPEPRRSIQELLSDLPSQLSLGERPAIELIYHVEEPLFLSLEQRGQAMLVVQEALLNAHRHANAEHINLILERRGEDARITVQDDGIGFDPRSWWENSQDHFGLGIIHARAARIGATLKIDSAPGQGTRVSLVLPLEADHCRIKLTAPPESSAAPADTGRG
jgi:signal transduction histidine kinase